MGQLAEARLVGLGVGSPATRRAIHVVAPEVGEFYGRQAFVVGWLAPARVAAGAPTLSVGGRKVEGYPVAADGAFSLAVHKDAGPFAGQPDDAPWATTLTAVYPDGVELTTTIPLTVNRLSPANAGEGGGGAGALAAGRGLGGIPSLAATRLPGPRTPRACARELVYPGEARTLRCKRVFLEILAGAVAQPTEITIEPLTEDELARLDPGLLNVTADDAGYRFLPHGLQFLKPVRVGIPYDKQFIPAGTPEEQTLTHYNQGPEARWHRLRKVQHDGRHGLVVSETDHFTDMINATLVLPEHPQPLAYNPTSIKDHKAADPSAEITLIEPPVASPFGAAQTSFPLRLPPGRGAYQPRVPIVYTGTTQNGWLGIGWDLSLSKIQIDTRFGVPRYTGQETYLLDRAQLAPAGDGRYQPRVEGAFRRIVRHGDDPASYWWEVTDKAGTRFVYGASSRARLASYATGHVFAWHLERVIDPNGNVTEIRYQPDSSEVAGTDGEPWVQLYPAEIAYTSHTSGLPARYRVRFVLDDGSRPDRLVDGRAGFKTVTRFRLDHIDVLFDETLIRRYQLTYRIGDFSKSLLAALAELGEGAREEFHRHEFDYFEMPKDGTALAGFTAPVAWGGAGRSDGLSRTDELSVTGGMYVGLGPTPIWPNVGFTVSYGRGQETGELALVDIDGDGLADLTRRGGSVRFGTLGEDRLAGFFRAGEYPGLGVLNETERHSFSAGASTHFFDDLLRITGQYTYSVTSSRSLLSDVNGDGFVDQIHGGAVLFNTGRGFSAASPLDGYSTADLDLGLDEIRNRVSQDFQLTDPVRRWKAPFAGRIRLESTLARRQAGGDGLRARVLLNTTPLWQRTVAPDDTAACTLAAGDACAPAGAGGFVLDVAAGDDLYFLLDSIDDTDFDVVSWQARVTYLEACRRDPLSGSRRAVHRRLRRDRPSGSR